MREMLIAVVNDATPFVFRQAQAASMFIPYGKFPHPNGLQIFDRTSADMLIRSLSAEGCPIYREHTDVPGHRSFNPLAPSIGTVIALTAADGGLAISCDYKPEGLRKINEDGYRYYSPFWSCEKVEGGMRPCQLISIGLTNSPRIPVHPLRLSEGRSAASHGLQILRRVRQAEVRAAVSKQIKRLNHQHPQMPAGAAYVLAFNAAAQKAPHLFGK